MCTDQSVQEFFVALVRALQPSMGVWLPPPPPQGGAEKWHPATRPLRDVVADAWTHGRPGAPVPDVAEYQLAGPGNMNLTLRLRCQGVSGGGVSSGPVKWILKQSRPWVHAYPQYSAPVERIGVEAGWYSVAAGIPGTAGMVPCVAGCSTKYAAMLCQDLGDTSDFTPLYAVAAAAGGDARQVLLESLPATAQFLGGLHSGTRGQHEAKGGITHDFTRNTSMRNLNCTHMYELPLADGNPMRGGPLDALEAGLEEAAAAVCANGVVVSTAAALRARYLDDSPPSPPAVLLHGDYFFGSWLSTKDGVFVIDAEFAHVGDAEFDVGVALAHMALAHVPQSDAQAWLETYAKHAAGGRPGLAKTPPPH